MYILYKQFRKSLAEKLQQQFQGGNVMKKALSIVLALCMTLGLAACAQNAAPAATQAAATEAAAPAKLMKEPLTLKVSYVEDPATGIGTVMPKAFEKITEMTNGELKFEIFPSGLLGTQADVVEQIKAGAPIIGTVGMNSLIDSLSPLATPYVLQNIDETLAFSKTDYYAKSVEELKAQGFVPVCMGSLGIRHTISTKEIKSAADFDGLIIRMAATEPSQGFAAVMNGTPVTAAWGDVYSMLSTGAIEATEAPLDLLYSTALYEVCDHLCMTAHLTTPFQFVMSTQYWDQIPAEYQKVMMDVLDDACVEMADIYKKADSEFVQKFKDAGVTVCENPDIDSFANVIPDLFKYLKWDENVYNEIRASIDSVK